MSPKVSITIGQADLVRLLKTPRTRVLEAVVRARELRIRLRQGEAGVIGSFSGWRLDRLLIPQGVSAMGAVLLHLQPEAEAGEEPAASAARALEVSLAWVEGLQDGWDRERTTPGARNDMEQRDYLDGFEAGLFARLSHAEGLWMSKR